MMDVDQIETSGLEGFVIENKNIIFTGVCPDCSSKTKKGE